MLRIETILVPTDFSDAADHALQVAASLARDHGGKLVLMTSPPPQPIAPPGEGYLPQTGDIRLVDDSRKALESVAQTIQGVPVETRLVMGSPGPCIVEAAAECHADLIVMGTHGHSGILRLLMGSVAEYVHRHAPCPVLTIKPTAKGLAAS